MEKLTRVEKYKKLREEIETKNSNEMTQNPISNIQNKEAYVPVHEKTFIRESESEKTSSNTFKNEYLDSFIKEVRDYNMKKGTREYEDTKLDILQQLNSKNREKRSQYIEPVVSNQSDIVNSDETIAQTNEISKQVMDLINDEAAIENEMDSSNQIEENIETEEIKEESEPSNIMTLEDRIASLESQITAEPKKSDSELISEEEKRELLEQTMQLKVQIDEYKEELNELNSGIDSNNRLLNIIITILIIALLAVIGVVIYWLISGGII